MAAEQPGSTAWIGEVNATAAVVLLALVDGDTEGAGLVLEGCTQREAALTAATLARAMVACCEPEDIPHFRATLAGLLQSGTPRAGG